MRLSTLSLLLIAAALFGEIHASAAQSPYSYPWCSKSIKGGALRCGYTSWEQCRTTQSGIGGVCMRSPYYRGAPPDARRRWPA
jgi:Protein of unknown function (DUF3551)